MHFPIDEMFMLVGAKKKAVICLDTDLCICQNSVAYVHRKGITKCKDMHIK